MAVLECRHHTTLQDCLATWHQLLTCRLSSSVDLTVQLSGASLLVRGVKKTVLIFKRRGSLYYTLSISLEAFSLLVLAILVTSVSSVTFVTSATDGWLRRPAMIATSRSHVEVGLEGLDFQFNLVFYNTFDIVLLVLSWAMAEALIKCEISEIDVITL